jgi:hypothetical protein
MTVTLDRIRFELSSVWARLLWSAIYGHNHLVQFLLQSEE